MLINSRWWYWLDWSDFMCLWELLLVPECLLFSVFAWDFDSNSANDNFKYLNIDINTNINIKQSSRLHVLKPRAMGRSR